MIFEVIPGLVLELLFGLILGSGDIRLVTPPLMPDRSFIRGGVSNIYLADRPDRVQITGPYP